MYLFLIYSCPFIIYFINTHDIKVFKDIKGGTKFCTL